MASLNPRLKSVRPTPYEVSIGGCPQFPPQPIDGEIPAEIGKHVLGFSDPHDEPHPESTERFLKGSHRLKEKADSMGPRSAEILNDVEMIPGIEDPGGKHLVLIRLEGLEEWLIVDPELAAEPEEVSAAARR